MRTFIGIDFTKKLKEQIIDVQVFLKSISKKGRWKYIDNFHLTLKFLGEVSYDDVEKIKTALKNKLYNIHPFELKISSCGYFKGDGNFRVVFLKPDGELNRLNDLYSKIEDALSSLGFEREKRSYTPHITIAQDVVMDDSFDKFKNYVEAYNFERIVVDKIILFLSEEIDRKRIYTPLFEIDLI